MLRAARAASHYGTGSPGRLSVFRPCLSINLMLRDQRGGIAALFGLSSAVLFTIAALVIDGGQLYVTKTKLQGTADAAALAAAVDLPNEGPAQAAALIYAMNNMAPGEHGPVLHPADVTFGIWDQRDKSFTTGATPPDAVRVTVRRSASRGNPVETHFAHLLGFPEVDVEASAIATSGNPAVCILALEPHDQKAIHLGNGTITANGCIVHVNSDNASQAISGNPNGGLSADAICVAGSYNGSPDYTPAPEIGCPPLNDPLTNLAAPAFGACDHTGYSINSGDDTLDPGVYCGGIDATTNGTVTFNPGLYVIKDGMLNVGGGADLVGSGVSFYLTGANARVDLSGGGHMTFSAPLTGPLAGILFFGDRNLAAGLEHSFKGSSSVHYEGTIYFPTTDVLFTGNGSGTSPSPYSFFIARRFEFTGNGEISINANYEASIVPIPPGVGPERRGLVK